MKLKKLLFTYNAFQFFFSLLLWVPIFYEFQKRIGLSDVEIFKIQSIYYLVFCLLEIPTGFLADSIGYRLCLILGSITLVFANILVPIAPFYVGFLTHFLLIALSRSFVSGASSAYLFEVLKRENLMEEYKEAEGRARAYSLIGKVLCWGVIGLVMTWNLYLPYWFTAFNALIALYFSLKLPDLKIERSLIKNNVLDIFSNLIKTPYLFLIMLQGVSLFVLARICQVNLFQPILESKGFSVVSYGMMMALMTIFEAFGSLKSKWVRRFVSDTYAVFIFTIGISISFYVLSYNDIFGVDKKVTTILALVFFSYLAGISFPIQKQLMNEAITNPNLRASMLSVESIIDRGVNSLVANSLGAALIAGNLFPFLREAANLSIISVFIIMILIKLTGKKKYELTSI